MICANCKKEFPNSMIINGKRIGLYTRKYCLDCSPFKSNGKHKMSKQYKCRECGTTEEKLFTKGRYKECKRCRSKYNIRGAKRNKDFAVNNLGGKCSNCGYNEFKEALDIHHVYPEEKDKNFSHHNFWSLEKLKIELEKCILLCRNCHAIYHSGHISFSNFSFVPENKKHLEEKALKYEKSLLKKDVKIEKIEKETNPNKKDYGEIIKKLALKYNTSEKIIKDARIYKRKTERPTYKEYLKKKEELNNVYSQIAKYYEVSNSMIKNGKNVMKNMEFNYDGVVCSNHTIRTI